MSKIKAKRHSPAMDMTPMVDMAFLLVTFFILTATMRPDEAVEVNLPSSISEVKVPQIGLISVTVDKTDKVYFSCDGQQIRREVLLEMGKLYNVNFTEEQLHKFAVINSFGVPIQALPQWLSLDDNDRKSLPVSGIPIDSSASASSSNQLFQWITTARRVGLVNNVKYRFAIKGDQFTNYIQVRKVMKVYEQCKVYKFNFVTSLEAGKPKGDAGLVQE
jgi:biopolymer transport protein ExbD